MRVAIAFAAATVSLCASVSASAVVLQEFGGTAVAGQGVRSNYVPLINSETFNGPNLLTGGPCAVRANIITEDSAGNANEVEGIPDFQQGSVTNRRLAPTGSDASNCYGIVNAPDFETSPGVPDDGMFLFRLPSNTLYLGFYWGSPDIYNYFRVYDGDYNRLNFIGPAGEDWGDTLSGDELIAAASIEAPDSVYVNFSFDFSEDAEFIGFGSSNWAFEFDNIAPDSTSPYLLADLGSGGLNLAGVDPNLVGVDPAQIVPAPAALGLFGLGVIALSGARRRKALLK